MKLALLKLLLDRLDVPHYLPDESELTERQLMYIDALVRCEIFKWPMDEAKACAEAEYERERYRRIGYDWHDPQVRKAARAKRSQGCTERPPRTLSEALERWADRQ